MLSEATSSSKILLSEIPEIKKNCEKKSVSSLVVYFPDHFRDIKMFCSDPEKVQICLSKISHEATFFSGRLNWISLWILQFI